MKEKCIKCGQMATWIYAPNDGNSKYCDNCVPRGCTCNWRDGVPEVNSNWKWLTPEEIKQDHKYITGTELLKENEELENKHWEYIDNGKRFPCCEYDYDKNGFDMEN